MRKLLPIQILFFFFAIPLLGFLNANAAGVFNITIDRVFTVDTEGVMHVKETFNITNNTTNLEIPKGSDVNFQILTFRIDSDESVELLDRSSATAKVYGPDGKLATFDKTEDIDKVDFDVPYPSSLRPGSSTSFRFEYTNYELSEKVGALRDIYIHGFDEDFEFNSGNFVVTYKTTLEVPKFLGDKNFVSPAPTSESERGDVLVYKFSQGSLVDGFVWLQLGKEQIYQFKIIEEVRSTEVQDTGFYNEYRIIIPRDVYEAEINQEVFYSSIVPVPKYIQEDAEGNLIGVFEFPTSFAGVITLEGYARVSVVGDINATDVTNVSSISSEFERYLNPAEFWEVDDPSIQEKAMELKGNKENVFEIVESTYRYIVDSIDYSNVKRFGINERQGAKATLAGGSAVCMEYSDLFLSLSRAQGIPVRAAFGYGYDSRVPDDEQVAHQWVEAYMPGIDKWVSIDVTWGESGTTLIGGDMNHFYTHVAATDPNTPAMVETLSYGSSPTLDTPQFEISVLDEIPDGEYSSSEELLGRYPFIEVERTLEDRVKQALTIVGSVLDQFGLGNSLVTAGVFVALLTGMVVSVSVYTSLRKTPKKETSDL